MFESRHYKNTGAYLSKENAEMAINIRKKGSAAEREALKWFMTRFPELGDLSRNLEQTRNGGADCLCIDGIALEIKRQENLSIGSWWEQTKRQALSTERFPVLMYRQNHKKWIFCIPASLITKGSWGYITLSGATFEEWFTARLSREKSKTADIGEISPVSRENSLS